MTRLSDELMYKDADPPGSPTVHGAPAKRDRNSISVGSNGPLLLLDHHLLDTPAHFNREYLPERSQIGCKDCNAAIAASQDWALNLVSPTEGRQA